MKILNLNSYEAKVLGRKRYIELAKDYNLTTKKWTYGRLKDFKKAVKNILIDEKKQK